MEKMGCIDNKVIQKKKIFLNNAMFRIAIRGVQDPNSGCFESNIKVDSKLESNSKFKFYNYS